MKFEILAELKNNKGELITSNHTIGYGEIFNTPGIVPDIAKKGDIIIYQNKKFLLEKREFDIEKNKIIVHLSEYNDGDE